MALGMGLVPIAPIILLPFILIVFVIVFPIWAVALGVVGLVLVIAMAVDFLARLVGVRALVPLVAALKKALHWVLTFGGFTEGKILKPKTRAPKVGR